MVKEEVDSMKSEVEGLLKVKNNTKISKEESFQDALDAVVSEMEELNTNARAPTTALPPMVGSKGCSSNGSNSMQQTFKVGSKSPLDPGNS